ncbi:hypothetical protein vseg_014000 [Gypsophila vaccaria]
MTTTTTTTTTGMTIHEQNLEKQIGKHMSGCMSGFFNIFERSHFPKRLPPPLPPPPTHGGDSASETVSSVASSPKAKTQQLRQPKIRSLATENEAVKCQSPSSPWKFTREIPRLSLDSRAVTDAKGGLRPREIRINNGSSSGKAGEDVERKSPSVIARLMGLEPLPSSVGSSGSGSNVSEPESNKAELRRSASESRSREYRFVDNSSFLSTYLVRNEGGVERKLEHPRQQTNENNNNNNHKMRNQNNNNNKSNNYNQRRIMFERRSYYDSTDFFPAEIQTKQQQKPVSIYGEIERRLNGRRIDESSKDLETLKHIIEAVKLKGLLHSSTTYSEMKARNNAVYDRRFFVEEESPIVLMKPTRPTSPASSTPMNRRRIQSCNVSSGELSHSPRKERPARSAMRSPGRGESRSSAPILRRKGGPVSLETPEVRRSHSPVQSPRPTRPTDQTVNRSPRRRRPTTEMYQGDRLQCGPTFTEDEMSAVSESCFSISSHTDNERWRVDDYMDGKNLLERCDKLLNNIAEITANSNSNSNSAELQQPSPVSVLDSSFYKEDESSPSPVKKRTIDFKDQVVSELEDGLWSPSSSNQFMKLDNDFDSSEDSEFSYISEVLRASNYLPDDNNLFFLIEKQTSIRGVCRDKSKTSILQRKLIFDIVIEILDRNRQLPPWKAASTLERRPMFEEIWSQIQKTREVGPSEDLVELICGCLKKDLSQDSVNGWDGFPMETSDAVLDIERLIFKDLIGETIRDLAALAVKSKEGGVHPLCRKLVF